MGDANGNARRPYAEVDEVLRRVREIDPGGARDAVARYVAEIDEMARVIERLDLALGAEVCAFSPAWSDDGSER